MLINEDKLHDLYDACLRLKYQLMDITKQTRFCTESDAEKFLVFRIEKKDFEEFQKAVETCRH